MGLGRQRWRPSGAGLLVATPGGASGDEEFPRRSHGAKNDIAVAAPMTMHAAAMANPPPLSAAARGEVGVDSAHAAAAIAAPSGSSSGT